MKYILTSPLLDGCITLEYEYDSGMLVQATFDFVLKDDQAKWLQSHFPVHVSLAEKLSAVMKGSVQKVDSIPGFADFYGRYGNKVGKVKAEAAWKKLKDTEKVLAVTHISKYKQSIKGWQDMLMPATYLNEKRFMDYVKDGL